MTRRRQTVSVTSEPGATAMRAVALALGVFGAGLMAPGRLVAQSRPPVHAAGALGVPGLSPGMAPQAQAEVAALLGAMSDRDLALAYARIHATFRRFLGHDDLSVARALIDYASLAEAELARRGLPRPAGTESASGMRIAYELVL